jgi:hypothetical protein
MVMLLLERPSRSLRTCASHFLSSLVFVPFSDMLFVLSQIFMVKCTSAYVILLLKIKLTRKLPNNLTL